MALFAERRTALLCPRDENVRSTSISPAIWEKIRLFDLKLQMSSLNLHPQLFRSCCRGPHQLNGLSMAAPQMSPKVKPSGKGSSGSTTYCAKPVIQAVPLSLGTTARKLPTRVSLSRQPVKIVPRIPSCGNGSLSRSLPLACSTAMRAQVPVPHGDRSIAPVHVLGLFQSSCPVETITAFLATAFGLVGAPVSSAIVMP